MDDMILCSDTSDGLLNIFGGLLEYCCKWHLIPKLTKKTKVMIFNSHG